jgi:hypothetical protein
VTWQYDETLDPYCDGLEMPKDSHQVERVYFACAHDSDIWIELPDLPEATRKEIEKLVDAGYYDEQQQEAMRRVFTDPKLLGLLIKKTAEIMWQLMRGKELQ